MAARTTLITLALLTTACAPAAHVVEPEPAPEVLASTVRRHIDGPAAGHEDAECARPGTLRGGRVGTAVVCHVGTRGVAPEQGLARVLHDDRALAGCFEASGVRSIEVGVEVAGDGRVAAIDVVAVDGGGVMTGSCLRLLTRRAFESRGCAWREGYVWATR